MAISLGKSSGDSSRKTSRRLLSQYGVDATIATKGLTPPGIKVSAPIVDTYQQVERMNAPQLQLGRFADMSVMTDNSKDLQNLANSLGQFSTQLQNFGTLYAKKEKQIDTKAKDYSKSLALQNFGSKKSAVEILQDTRVDLQKIVDDADATIEQKKAAEKNLDYIDSRNNILIPHLQSQNRIVNIQANAATLSSKAGGAMVIKNGIEVPLSSLRPDDPVYLEWRQNAVYGDGSGGIIPLTDKEGKEVSATVLSAYANDTNRQEKAVIQYNKDMYESESLVQVDGYAAIHLDKNNMDDVVKGLNGILDDSRFLQLYRTKEERDNFIKKIIAQWEQALFIRGQETGVFLEADEAFEPWLKLMTGKKEDRLIKDNDKNSPTFGQEIINPKLLWHKSFEPAWEANTKYQYNIKLANAKNQQKTTKVQIGNNAIDKMFTEEILPELKKIDEMAEKIDGGFASDKVQTELTKIKQTFEEKKNEIIANVPIRFQEEVLTYANKKIVTSDGLLFGPERKLLQTELGKEYTQVFLNPQKAVAFRDKVNKLIESGAIDVNVGMNLINRTNTIVSEIAKPNQEFAADIIKTNLDKFASSKNKGYFYSSDSPGGSEFILEEQLELSNAEQKMTDGANKIIEEGLKNGKSTQVINTELTKYFQETDFGLVSKYQSKNLDGEIPKAFDSIDDFKNRFIGVDQKGKIDNKEATQLVTMYKSKIPMLPKEDLVKLLDDWNTNGIDGIDKDVKKMLRALKKYNGVTPYQFFNNQLFKYDIPLSETMINDIDGFNKKYSKINTNTPKPPSFIQKIAMIPVELLLGGSVMAGEVNNNPYNYIPAEGTQTIPSMLKIALTSDFTEDEAVVMAAIGMAESSGRPHAHNTEGDDNSYGLWQINMLDRPGFMMGEERRGQLALDSNEQLFDPIVNGQAAKYIYDMQGFDAWTVYKTGAYKKYLPAAQEALNSLFN